MKTLTKKLLLGATAAAFACVGAATLGFNQTTAFADEDPNVIVEFSESDSELFGTYSAASFVTGYAAGDETIATGAKFVYSVAGSRPGDYWGVANVTFKESFTAADAYTMSFRFNTHLTKSGSNPTVAFYSLATGDPILWKEIDNQGEWNTFTVSRSDYKKLANPEGKITGFTIAFYPSNGTRYEGDECYVLLDQVIIDDACAIELDNNKDVTGVDNTEVRMARGSDLHAPSSQIFGKGVTWYEDEARTTPFDFTGKKAETNITLYGVYSDTLEPTKGVVTEFSKADARYFIPKDEQGQTILPADSSSYKTENHVEYITDIDVDGNGVIDDCERNAIKVSNWSSARESIGFEFANPVDIDDIMGVTFRIYTDFKGLDTYCLWTCEGATLDSDDGSSVPDPYHSGILWSPVQQGRWYDVTFPAAKDYVKLAGTDGKFDSFVWNFCPVVALGQSTPAGTYVVFGSITYNYKCNVTFDCDTANSGVSNLTAVYASGKAISEAPEQTQKEGYTVTWYSDAARTQKFNLKKDKIEGDITLYAVYTASDYTVTFDYNKEESGIDPEKVSVTIGGKVTAPTTTREGYTIQWCVDPELTELYDFDSAVTKNITLYAKYVKSSGKPDEGNKGGCGSALASDMALCAAALTGVAVAVAAVRLKRKKK